MVLPAIAIKAAKKPSRVGTKKGSTIVRGRDARVVPGRGFAANDPSYSQAAGSAVVRSRIPRVKQATKKSLLKRSATLIRSFQVVWLAVGFDLLQLTLNSAYIGLFGLLEVTGVGAVVEFFGGQEAALILWGISVFVAIVGYAWSMLWFGSLGVKIFSGTNAGAKWGLFILCLVGDLTFPINGYVPGLTIWAIYLTLHPK